MSFRKAVRVVCGLAGGSAALLAAAALAESRGVFGEKKPGEPGCRRGWSGIAVLRAAQSLTAVNPTVAPSGFGWDSNWDKCVFKKYVDNKTILLYSIIWPVVQYVL